MIINLSGYCIGSAQSLGISNNQTPALQHTTGKNKRKEQGIESNQLTHCFRGYYVSVQFYECDGIG
jgi:hypothetical protein